MGVLDAFRLDGQTAVVTGASRGIGSALAVALAEAGADVIGVSRHAGMSRNGTGEAVRRAGRSYVDVIADLSSLNGVHAAIASIAELGVVPDILINNAGIAHRAPAEDHSDADWSEVLDVDLTAPFVLARELGQSMLERGRGKIVFIASMMTFQGGRNVVSYAAAKSGVAGVVRALANEWASRGVNVNAIAPGYIETDLTQLSHADPTRREEFVARIPAGRWGRGDDLAGAVTFLCSPASEYIHGVVLPVDGGWLTR